MTFEWDAGGYEVLAAPMTGWGAGLLELALGRWPLAGDESAMDAGCGTGRVTELLLERLPRGTVLAVDASGEMVEAARGRFAADGRVRVEKGDLLALTIEERFDLVLSTATFHWIKDHERLFRRLARALKPGGRLVAQCGGAGNIARVRAATRRVMETEMFLPYFTRWEDPWNFAGPAETRERLEAAGFGGVETWLHEEPVRFGSVGELARYLKAIVLGRHLEALPEVQREQFAAAVAGELAAESSLVVDYVRLNILATRTPVPSHGGRVAAGVTGQTAAGR